MFKQIKTKRFFTMALALVISCSYFSNVSGATVNIAAQSAILVEQTTGKVLFGKNETKRIYPASMTKILTAITALPYFDLSDIIITGDEVKAVPAGSSLAHHRKGEALTFENIIRGLIIPSGNETANVVAAAVIKKITGDENIPYEEAEKQFCALMNEKAKSLGATGTNFVNPHGFHDPNHYSTAYDMALFSRAAMNEDIIRQVAFEKVFQGNGAGISPDKSLSTQVYTWETHNSLIMPGEFFYEYATGIKTGITDEAGPCVAASAEKDGVKLVAVVANSPSSGRWKDAIKLFDYGFDNFGFKTIQEKGIILEAVPIYNPRLDDEEELSVLTSNEFVDFLSNEDTNKIKKTVSYNDELIAKDEKGKIKNLMLNTPIEANAVIGTVSYSIDDNVIFEDKLLAEREVLERTFKSDLNYYLNSIKKVILTKKAIPYWIGSIVIIGILIRIAMMRSQSKRNRGYYSYKYRRR